MSNALRDMMMILRQNADAATSCLGLYYFDSSTPSSIFSADMPPFYHVYIQTDQRTTLVPPLSGALGGISNISFDVAFYSKQEQQTQVD